MTSDAQARKTLAAFTSYLCALFERKRRTPADDMITQMVHAQEDGDKLNEKELLSMVFILYLGGHLTTENLIGKGIHVCLGAPLARIEGQIAFETLFRSFPELRLAVPANELRWGAVTGLRGFRELPVLF